MNYNQTDLNNRDINNNNQINIKKSEKFQDVIDNFGPVSLEPV
jgi:hypothetical protein